MQPSPLDIQSHLYSSFLQASTYDVALRVSGTWNAVYKLHRVVLIQSGFLRSLFTSGFSESAVKLTTLRNGTDEINITFDDLNITRAAQSHSIPRICISRLYGGGPSLHISPNLIPTTNYPLTPPFSGIVESEEIPPGTHPATPRFLQSLLATAIYLSIPSVASQALALIFKTIGPNTVLQYLNFACGISAPCKEDVIEEPEAAVGLENVAQLLDLDEVVDFVPSVRPGGFKSRSLDGSDRNSSVLSAASSAESATGDFDHPSHEILSTSHHYGAVSDKIGEACVCWLTRWATDILQLEADGDVSFRPRGLSSLNPSKVAAVISDKTTSIKPPVIWGSGGLSAKWAAAIISADTLFIKNEKERYNLARSVVALRRCGGILEEEEPFWTDVFEHGIYYSNMTFEDILYISQDICPITTRPYVSLSTLQASHWTQSILRHHILNRGRVSSPGSPSSPAPRDKELGINLTTADILGRITKADKHDTITSEKDKPYFPVFSDASLRIGDSGTNVFTTPTGTPLSMEDLFNPSHLAAHNHPRPAGVQGTSLTNMSTREENFFGIMNARFSGHRCIESDSTGKFRWSPFPPFRFSVEFWDIDLLKEKSRLHSQTIWHAGSLFNVYVQIVRKKGQAQLGIYLHRQSIVDIPPCSAPSLVTHIQTAEDGNLTGPSGRQLYTRQLSLPSTVNVPSSPTHYSPSIHPPTRSTTPSANPNHARPSSPPSPSASPPLTYPSISGTYPPTPTTFAPQQPYRDPRASVSAYFAISCASATGSSQTRFSSSPDVFSVSQSWGWKSSTLRTEDFVEVGIQTLPNPSVRGDEISFRATVLLGLV
ncbi:hypothetical protein M413DRAFT_7093 [Hebeloma cylindrosporum]|uniref:BTB domain-containing protein n=1 Tax=Hebeloma cylindrosporum TaxID=76867 RepID=A0A0C2Z408_HEBCY|nr:hypothetical protein M413DRAFT_7093 [Hebeloma cylindrosporum h7]